MENANRLGTGLRSGCLAALLLALSGCYHVPHTRWEHYLQDVPTCQRQQVHVILVDSFVDVFHIGRIPQIADRLRADGFCNTQHFNPYRDGGGRQLATRILAIKQLDPTSRVMLVGWSAGSTTVVSALNLLQQGGIVVDSVMYLDSSFLKLAIRHGHPWNVGRTILAYRHCNPVPPGVPNAEVLCVNEPAHLAIPTREPVFNKLLSEVHRLADAPPLVQYNRPLEDPWLPASFNQPVN